MEERLATELTTVAAAIAVKANNFSITTMKNADKKVVRYHPNQLKN